MSVDTTRDPTDTETLTATSVTTVVDSGRAGLWRWIGMPLFIVAIVVVVVVAINTTPLDSIEQRSLNVETLLAAAWRHIVLTVVSTGLVLVIAIPLGIALTRRWTRSFRGGLLTVANIAQAVPTIGLIALMAVAFNWIGFGASVVALMSYAVLPVLRNTMVGIQGVDPSVLEAGRGMGMSRMQVLRRLELPLATPVMLAGIRTALVINVGTATLAAYINAGGLGQVIIAGLATNRLLVTLTGAALTAALALAIDYVSGVAEDLLRPKGL